MLPNSSFSVVTPDAAAIGSVALLRLDSVTHHFNPNQRYLRLSFQTAGGSLTVQAPANANIALPGHYMLFIVGTHGVPSIATILRLP